MIKLTLFSQLLIYLPGNIVASKTTKYKGDKVNTHFDTKAHLIVLIASQIKGWDSLREIETGFLSKEKFLYHLGIEKLPKRSTLSDANTKRNNKIFEEIFYELLQNVQSKLKSSKKLIVKKEVNLFDATVITLSLELFEWATFRREGGFKIHTAFNVQSQTPIFAQITQGNVNDIDGCDGNLDKYKNSIVVFDRGYSSFSLFKKLNDLEIIFVTRLKRGINYTIISTSHINKNGVITDEVAKFTGDKVKRVYLENLRLVTYHDKATKKDFKFLTNNFKYSPKTIAYLYKKRWDIELFFKWVKQNLVIKKYLGHSENAVRTQVWSVLIIYVLLIYIKQSIDFEGTMLEFTRLVKESLFDDIGLIDLKNKKFISPKKTRADLVGQSNLF
jgi:hypothetical protein